MTPAPTRPRHTRLQRVLTVVMIPLLIFNLVGIARAVWESRPVQTWQAQRTGLPVYLRGGRLYEGLDHAAQSPDGRWVAIGGTREYGASFTARVALWEAATMKRRWTTDRPTSDFRSVNALVWSSDSRSVWIHDTEGRVTALDAGGGRVRGEWRSFEYQPCVFAALPQGLLLTDAAGPERDRPCASPCGAGRTGRWCGASRSSAGGRRAAAWTPPEAPSPTAPGAARWPSTTCGRASLALDASTSAAGKAPTASPSRRTGHGWPPGGGREP
ncbi:hypothetical protein [Deinococcus reticulitermitis]|uniref:hypothetical protein n=1 Tax=Deinococcus reticulitermitis TaxID=856736 RepID=UPI001160D9C8|nr:hypothetical protein [Deinococcus reticulitermitis]